MKRHNTPFGDSPYTYSAFWIFWLTFLFWPLLLPGLTLKIIVWFAWVAVLAAGLALTFYLRERKDRE